ncbi:PQQ-dependent sugar dehydrogenase [Nocardioides sambongensis]|uniref:PQQ-dependent sugar dehydrogenase n=1 Tax=Nocardioides sambongensis TaxID=2589074 RepID=UPI001126DEBE|nr:PQQ-dependent sugar dehydrogenase [Nocardioides sambongensis]
MRTVAALAAASTLVLTLGLSAPGVAEPPASHPDHRAAQPDRTADAPAPRLRVRVVTRGLDIPWDVRPTGDGALLLTERDRQRLSLIEDGRRSTVRLRGERIWSSGETGLMGLEVDPRFARNGRFYTCSGWSAPSGGHDIRVIRWRLNEARTSARISRTLLTGLPTTSGRHGGCRLLIARNGSLLIGTGDAAVSRNPQNRRSLGGKVLRIDRNTGRRWPGNPWAGSKTRSRFVLTYGHRNVQGLAQRADGSLWSVEHGSYRNDEVNLLRGGRNYGWDPGPGYDESVPMTDHSLPGKQWNARWRSGNPTIATSGATFLPRRGWRSLGGTLAVAALAGERLVFLRFDQRGRLTSQRVRLRGDFGRLRSVTVDTNGSLLVTTSNGGGRDRLLRVRVRR